MELWTEHLLLLRAMQEWGGLRPSLGATNPRLEAAPAPKPGWIRRAARRLLVWIAEALIVVGTRLKAACTATKTGEDAAQRREVSSHGTAAK